jgi:hypothetical protein
MYFHAAMTAANALTGQSKRQSPTFRLSSIIAQNSAQKDKPAERFLRQLAY